MPTDDYAFNTITSLYADKTFIFYGAKYHYIIRHTGITGISNNSETWDIEHIKAFNFIYDYLKEHNSLDDRLKKFQLYPFFKVDTQEKFECYKTFFEKIREDFYKNQHIYNELERFFINSILSSQNIEEYLSKYHKDITIGLLRDRINNKTNN